MKKVKFLLSLILVLALLTLVGCGSKGVKDVSEVEKMYKDTIEEYTKAKACDVLITLKTGEKTETIDLKYSYNGETVEKLAAVMKNDLGEVSVYVVDGVAYMARYNSDKVYYTIDATEQKTITTDYVFSKFVKELVSLYSTSFFKASAIDESSKTNVKLTCDVNALEVDESLEGDEYFKQQDEIDKLQAMTSVKLEVEYASGKVSKLVGTFVSASGVENKITVEFKGLTVGEVTVPNKDQYKAK